MITFLTESTTKLLLSIGLVAIGWSVNGSISGILVATGIGLFLSYIFTAKHLFKSSFHSVSLTSFLGYSFPVLVYSIAGTSLFSTDLLLVKHFFTSQDAGTYAALSTMGKIIVFGASPVTSVMFPLVAKRQAEGESFNNIFWYGFLLMGAICGVVLLGYLFFPALAVGLLYGNRFLQAANLLFPFAAFVSIFTLATYLIGFFLSTNFTKVVIIPLLAAILQIVGISLFHSSLLSVITVSIIVTSIMFIVLITLLTGRLGKINS